MESQPAHAVRRWLTRAAAYVCSNTLCGSHSSSGGTCTCGAAMVEVQQR